MGKLVLGRKTGQSLVIGEAIVTVERIAGNRVTLSVIADKGTKVLRAELERHEPEEQEAAP